MKRLLSPRSTLIALLATSAALTGCSPAAEPITGGPVAQALARAADDAHVPRDLLVAIAAEEGGLRFAPHRAVDADDHVQVAGYLELRHGKLDTLAAAAELAGTTEDALVEDTILATQMGAQIVADLGAQHGATSSLASWLPALEELSGLSGSGRYDYAKSVLSRLQTGGRYAAYAGEIVTLAAHDLELPGSTVEALGGNTPQFAGALWFTTSCTGKCNVGRTAGVTVDTIVIHDTEGGWTASVATLQNDAGKSVHYIVDADGSRVGQFRSEDDITWHSGNSVYNGKSVGIEHVGYTTDPNGYADALYATSVKLVDDIRTRHAIPVDRAHIVGHYQVPDGTVISESDAACTAQLMSCEVSNSYGGASNHRDPGPKWQWCPYMQALGGTCACADVTPLFNCTTNKTQAVRCVNGEVELRTCAQACVVEATGVDDSCEPATTVTPTGSFHGSITYQATSSDPGGTTIVVDGTNTGHQANLHGGCNTTGSPSETAELLLVAAFVALLLRRRQTA